MNLSRPDPSPRGHGTDSSSLDRVVHDTLARIRAWHRRNKERSELIKLTDLEMHDFGMTRADAIAEANKPFWRE